jgi:hypothetical protein
VSRVCEKAMATSDRSMCGRNERMAGDDGR